MPSVLHEVLVALIREQPHLLIDLLGERGVAWGADVVRARAGETSLSQVSQLDADLVLELLGPRGHLRRALVVEVQLRRARDKERAWPAYQAGVHHRLGCPVYVVVLTIDGAVARWAAGPFDTGQTLFRPWVIGPQHVPIITNPERARRMPSLTLLSGLAHRHEHVAEAIGDALLHALDHGDADADAQRNGLYFDLFLHVVNEAARKALMMKLDNYRPHSEWGKRFFAEGQTLGRREGEALGRREGEALGERRALWVLLDARGLVPSPAQRAAIEACHDVDTLQAWVRRAATATAIDHVFDDG